MFNLGMLAYYDASPAANRLDHGHTVPIGQGWVDGSPLDQVLISLPYPWGPELEHCEVGKRLVRVLWALPIYEVERQFKVSEGLEAFEQRLEAAAIDPLDMHRPPVV